MNWSVEIAPMQGFVDSIYRRAYHAFFAGTDAAYTPFLTLEKNVLRGRDRRELADGTAEGPDLTPQIAAATPEEASRLKQLIVEAGFQSLNLNLGCPYPMVTKRKMGAGALPHPALVDELLSALCSGAPKLAVSVKTRLGLLDETEFESILPILNRYDLKKVILHPRTATDMYDGPLHLPAFSAYGRQLSAPLIANGDLRTAADVHRIREQNPFIGGVMLGRGLLSDPFLPSKIKGLAMPEKPFEVLSRFHAQVLAASQQRLSGSHVLDKMHTFWFYLCDAFPNSDKWYKKIKKTRHLSAYLETVEAMVASSVI